MYFDKVSLGDFKISDILVCENINLIACSHEDYEPMNKVGMMWSLVDTECFGTLTFWKVSSNYKETERIAKLDFEQRISKLLTDKESKVFIIGTDDGELQIIPREVILDKKPLSESHYRNKVLGGRMIGLSWIVEGKVLAISGTDNFLRLFDMASLKVVGGGSLNKRLEGGMLTTMEVDQAGSRIFFGSTKGTIMCYKVNTDNYQPSFVYTIALGSGALTGMPVTALAFSHENIFIGCGSQVLIYNVTGSKEPTNVPLVNI